MDEEFFTRVWKVIFTVGTIMFLLQKIATSTFFVLIKSFFHIKKENKSVDCVVLFQIKIFSLTNI